MTTYLPTDSDNNPIPALRLKDNKAHKITSSTSSARNSVAFEGDTKVVSIYATQDVFLRFGNNSVTATTSDHFFPAGVYYDVSIGGDKTGHSDYLAVIQSSASGIVYISEKS